MGYMIKDDGIKKISAPIVCKLGDKTAEFANGATLAEAAFDTPCEVAEITVAEGRLVVCLTETQPYAAGGFAGGDTARHTPRYGREEAWVKQHVEQFGEEPGFF